MAERPGESDDGKDYLCLTLRIRNGHLRQDPPLGLISRPEVVAT